MEKEKMKKYLFQITIVTAIISISSGAIVFMIDGPKFFQMVIDFIASEFAFAFLIVAIIIIIIPYIVVFLMKKIIFKNEPFFSKVDFNTKALQEVKSTLNEFKNSNLKECQNLCEHFGSSLEDIKMYNRIAGKLKDILFHLALQGHEYSYDKTKDEDEGGNKKYAEELFRLEGNKKINKGETPILKKVYVITNDMSLDIYSEQFNKVIKMNNASNYEKKYNTIYKYIIPRGVMVEVPTELEPRVREVVKKHNIGKINKYNWPELSLPDIYRFKYFDEIYEEEDNHIIKSEKFIRWTKKRSELFLEVDPEIFKIFGPSPERTIYFHQLENETKEGKIIVSLFLKSEKYYPSSGNKFDELDMVTIELDEDHSAVQEIKDMISDFEKIWDKLKNTNFDYPILNLMDVPFLLEEKADKIWVLTPDLVFDNTFVPIRTLVKNRLDVSLGPGDAPDFKYKFIIPYNQGDRTIGKHLKIFFKAHNISAIEKINEILNEAFLFVSSNVLAKFSIFGEVSLYRNVNTNSEMTSQNVLCFFPPVSGHLYGGFNEENKTEIDATDFIKEFGKSNFVKYADFAIILNETFTQKFEEHMEAIIAREPETTDGEQMTYYDCTYDGNKYNFSIFKS